MNNLKFFFGIYFIYFLSVNVNLGDSFSIDWKKIIFDYKFRKHPYKTDPVPRKKTEDIIREAGYVAERHEVKTEDNYWLIIHRIPRGKDELPKVNKPVVILQHGLFGSSAGWVLTGPQNGLGFILADNGYDVWMPNIRGNTYSKRHEFLDPKIDAPRFWNFSFHEMGYYDMPATIDYIVSSTGQEQIYYIGHSMGSTISYVLSSTRPEYNKRIKVVLSLAPVAFLAYLKSPLIRLMELSEPEFSNYLLDIDEYEILPQSRKENRIGSLVCNHKWTYRICQFFMALITGFDFHEMDLETLNKINEHFPAGASLKTLTHFGQLIRDRTFHQFNYGWGDNFLQYGTITVPEYELEKADVPVIMFFGKNDWISDREDVDKLFNKLPHIVGKIIIEYKKFNHLDFLFAKDVKDLVYDKIINILNRYRDGGTTDNNFIKQFEKN